MKEKKREENMTDIIAKIEEANATVPSLSTKEKAKQHKITESSYTYEAKDVILYALGVGVKGAR